MVPLPSVAIIPERDLYDRPVLECRHLGIDFGGLRAVDDFNFTVGKTEIAGLIGPNGAGKSTVFNLLTKVYNPTRGMVMLDGTDTAGMDAAAASRLGVARTFQNIRLFSSLTVEDNALWRPAQARDRPSAGHQPEALAARRACRWHEPVRDGRAYG